MISPGRDGAPERLLLPARFHHYEEAALLRYMRTARTSHDPRPPLTPHGQRFKEFVQEQIRKEPPRFGKGTPTKMKPQVKMLTPPENTQNQESTVDQTNQD